MVIEKGTIKVVWLSKNRKKIFSKMFESEDEAEKFGKKKRKYLIFKLIKQKRMKEFEWEILHYGMADIYLMFLKNF